VFEPRRGVFDEVSTLDAAWQAEKESGEGYDWLAEDRAEYNDDATLPPPCAEMWELASVMQINIYLVNHRIYRRITGHNAPPSPITQHNRDAVGLP
jgi:hypothetical protein